MMLVLRKAKVRTNQFGLAAGHLIGDDGHEDNAVWHSIAFSMLMCWPTGIEWFIKKLHRYFLDYQRSQ